MTRTGYHRIEKMVPLDCLSEWVHQHGGDFFINSVLIASNGLAAVKGIKSIRKWSYETFGDARVIRIIAMAAREDIEANSEFIKLSDEYVEVPAGPNYNNYANVDLIVSIAQKYHVQAVWAGWGHASENPRLPDILHSLEPRIAFIGPPGSAMRALGDKISSMIVAQSAQVDTVAWSGTGLVMSEAEKAEGIVSDAVYRQACCATVEEGLQAAQKIGLPVMIKASEGGGGKGIRKVEMMDQFGKLFKMVQSEVPGSPIFVMKVAENAKHLEVQLIADKHGNVTTLFGRDCSVQRRHQKILEEAPITVAPPEVMKELEEAAIRLGQLVKYQNVGTVEYLYDPASKEYCFLELNPRLQVEHPTTEMVSGTNIPACQLMIAMGIPLYRISYIRKLYGQEAEGDSKFDLGLAKRNAPLGHVIAARITAENPSEGFKPNGGSLHQINLSALNKSWGYFSVQSKARIHDYSDSQFGHIFSHGGSRKEAQKLLTETLRNTVIQADFRTNINYVASLLEHEKFLSNDFSTDWLDGLIKAKYTPSIRDVNTVAVCAATILASKVFKQRRHLILDSLHKRHYPSKDHLEHFALCKFIYKKVSYEFEAWQCSEELLELKIGEERIQVKLLESTFQTALITLPNRTHYIQIQDSSHCLNLIIDGHDCLIEFENDPSSVRAPSSGRIVKLLVDDGCRVTKDAAICEIEVMKMYLPVYCQGTGILTFKRQVGSAIQAGDLLASIELEDKANIPGIQVFSDRLTFSDVVKKDLDVLDRFSQCYAFIRQAMDGYQSVAEIDEKIGDFVRACNDPALPYLKLKLALASLRAKLPADLVASVSALLEEGSGLGDTATLHKIEEVIGSDFQCEPLLAVIRAHSMGPLKFSLGLLKELVQEFMACEKLFDTELTIDGPLIKLFGLFEDNLGQISKYVHMHAQLPGRIQCLLRFIDCLIDAQPDCLKSNEFEQLVKQLSLFSAKEYSKLTRRCRELMITSQIPSLDELFARMEAKLENALKFVDNPALRADFIHEMVQGFTTHLDVIPRFFHHSNPNIRKLALEIYTKRVFATYLIMGGQHVSDEEGLDIFEWTFSTLPKEDVDENGSSGGHRRRPSSATVYPIVGLHNGDSAARDQHRRGYMVSLEDLKGLRDTLRKVLLKISARPDEEPNHLYLVAKEVSGWSDDQHAAHIQKIITEASEELGLHRVRRLTLAIVRSKIVAVGFYTYSQSRDYQEDLTIRHIEPAMAYLLEFPRLKSYEIDFCWSDISGQLRIYLGTEKSKEQQRRLFIRLVVRPNPAMRGFESMTHFGSQASSILDDLNQAVEAVQDQHRSTHDNNHLFINIVPVFYNQPADVQFVLQQLVEAYRDRWAERRIRQVELRMSLAPGKDASSCRYRFYLNNETGLVTNVQGYREVKDPLSGFKYLSSLDAVPAGPLDGYPVTFHYPLVSSLQAKRNRVLSLETPYIYDFPQLFQQAIKNAWHRYHAQGGEIPAPSKLMELDELVLGENGKLHSVTRKPGLNSIGMVAWRFKLFTPEAPTGRDMIVIGNDISVEIGSFGVEEDRLFHEASRLARAEGIPRVYLAANSGARIGLADELKNLLKVSWLDPAHPEAGFEYLYLDQDDFATLKPGVVNCERTVSEGGEVRHRIIDIIGAKNGLGVENLQGSALIAGETSRAYEEIFTLSLVTGRSVGIGAYLLRLGQRVIQKKQHPIILTGVGALNNLLGREVYQSNLQLGGPQIMFANGVSHLVVRDDLEGVQEILNWLSFVPLKASLLPPIIRTRDNPFRPVSFTPTAGQPYDPRWLIEGKQADGAWLTGLFDRGSFTETLSGWAKTVVTGRARLGGYPVGVIAVETRTVEAIIPADPANLNSTAQKTKQAGQVWYPDSAFKTAQAIRDFSHGEALPIVILANWRGFSGGQRDLYEQVLKFGSFIVDALKDCKQPVFIYLPPEAELRGGSWVVLDSLINEDGFIEMYADPAARGGILEPEGIVGVKFRPHHYYSLMERLDQECRELADQIDSAPTPALKEELSRKLAARRTKLLPIYRQIACSFADAHDKPGRMKAKQVIKEIVPWKQSRSFFYQRLRRLQLVSELLSLIKGYRLTLAEKRSKLAMILLDNFGIDLANPNDEQVFDSISEHSVAIKAHIKNLNVALGKAEISRIVSELASDIPLEGLVIE